MILKDHLMDVRLRVNIQMQPKKIMILKTAVNPYALILKVDNN